LEFIRDHLSEEDLSVEKFGSEMGMSRTQLHRKIKALTNLSASEFIRSLRLKHAAILIEQKYGTMAEIAYEVGFNNPSYFAECFRKQFGKSPSQYAD
jgi:AraC-like DNA-binding protein